MCGSGGVGKTTAAAAMAVQAASEIGGRVLVLTVDPARRLADALGVGAIGNEARLVPPEAFAASGVEPRGELWAAMLDTKAGWDELIRRHTPNAAVRASVLANPLYQNITGRFVHSHDYLAMDQLHELHASGRFDLIIVDTPPSRNALDVLDAPGRMKEFFGSRLLKWLTLPYRSRLFTAASKPFYQVADRVLGHGSCRTSPSSSSCSRRWSPASSPTRARSSRCGRPAHHVRRGVDARSGADPRGVVPGAGVARPRHAPRGDHRQPRAAGGDHVEGVRHQRPQAGGARQRHRAALAARSTPTLMSSTVCCATSPAQFHDTAMVATRESKRRAELAALAPLLVSIPLLAGDANDVADLLEIADHFDT